MDNLIGGSLHYDESQDRLYAVSEDGDEHYFHCGEWLQIWFIDAWEETYVEHSDSRGPYLVNYYQSSDLPDGLLVRYYD